MKDETIIIIKSLFLTFLMKVVQMTHTQSSMRTLALLLTHQFYSTNYQLLNECKNKLKLFVLLLVVHVRLEIPYLFSLCLGGQEVRCNHVQIEHSLKHFFDLDLTRNIL